MSAPFKVKDCTLISIATGKHAQNLKEFLEKLSIIHPGSIYYHFWGGLLRPRFGDPEYNNDFAAWTRHGLHDGKLAERLGIIDPTDFKDIEDLRQEVMEVVEERLDETEMYVPWARSDEQFHFIRSQIVVFDTHKRIEHPEELVSLIQNMSVGSIFYHFVDARRRCEDAKDDFRCWLEGLSLDYNDLCEKLSRIDPYFVSLTELRVQLSNIFEAYFKGKD